MTRALLGRPSAAPTPEGETHDAIREALAGGAKFWSDCSGVGLARRRAPGAVGSRLGGRGDERLVGAAPRRAPLSGLRARPARRGASRARASSRRPRRRDAGRSPAPLFDGVADRRALAELLLERHGIVTRDSVRAEGIAGGYGAVYGELKALETLGSCRRGYFVEGLGGAQFALGGAVERLRELRRAKATRRSRSCSRPPTRRSLRRRSPVAEALGRARGARRGAHVVLLGGEPALYVERGGRSLVPLREPDDDWLVRPLPRSSRSSSRRSKAARGRALRRRAGHGDGRHAAPRRGRLPRRPAPRRSAGRAGLRDFLARSGPACLATPKLTNAPEASTPTMAPYARPSLRSARIVRGRDLRERHGDRTGEGDAGNKHCGDG